MSFAQLFWILSATGAVLFFCAGLAAGRLKGQRVGPMKQIEIARLNALEGGTKTFQSILDRLSTIQGIRAAVLGDSMGLPVAAIGEQSESLAGFCGLISQAASKANDFLALGSIRRIVIEDERTATLTACSVPGTDIFLATLTAGPGPDLPRMVQLLNDVKSFMSQRSQT